MAKRKRTEWTPQMEMNLKARYLSGEPLKSIAESYGTKETSLRSKLYRMGVTGEGKRKPGPKPGRKPATSGEAQAAEVKFYGQPSLLQKQNDNKLKVAFMKDGAVTFFVEGDYQAIKQLIKEMR